MATLATLEIRLETAQSAGDTKAVEIYEQIIRLLRS